MSMAELETRPLVASEGVTEAGYRRTRLAICDRLYTEVVCTSADQRRTQIASDCSSGFAQSTVSVWSMTISITNLIMILACSSRLRWMSWKPTTTDMVHPEVGEGNDIDFVFVGS